MKVFHRPPDHRAAAPVSASVPAAATAHSPGRSGRAGRRGRSGACVIAAGLVAIACTAAAFLPAARTFAQHPTPSAVPLRWELAFEPGPLRTYVDPVEGTAYWYMPYVVTNLTGQDQTWAPEFVLFADTGEILRSGEGVPSRVEERLRELLGNPLLETQNEIIGDIRQGREHARDGLAVWPLRRTRLTEFSVFIGGISGETARIVNPVTGAPVILRKSLERRYRVPGDPLARGSTPVELVSERWVMR